MKTLFRLVTALLFLLVLGSCTGKDSPAPAEISFNPQVLEFEATENLEKTLTVTANTYWTVKLSEGCDWLILPFAASGGGETLVDIKAFANYTEDSRSASLIFETFDNSIFKLDVHQSGYVKPDPGEEPQDDNELEGLVIGEQYDWK